MQSNRYYTSTNARYEMHEKNSRGKIEVEEKCLVQCKEMSNIQDRDSARA